MGLFNRKNTKSAPESVSKDIKTREKNEEKQREALMYAKKFAAKSIQQTIHDPTGKTSRRTNRSYTTYDKETLENYLNSPTSNEKNLRDASIALYQTNRRYSSLLDYYANIPCWLYMVDAVNYNPDKVNRDSFKKQYYKVMNVLETMDVAKTMREVTLVALREGVYYGVKWGSEGQSFLLQKLDPDNCQIVGLGDGGIFQFAYDMSKVNEKDLETHYPPEFKDMWSEYQRTKNQYQVVPPNVSVCLKADPTIPGYSIPPFAAILPELYTIKNMQDLFETATELSNYKMLSGVIPVDDDGVPLIDYETVMQYYQHTASNVGDRVGVAFTPFKLESHDFEQSGASTQIDTVSRATENFFASAGTSAALHGAGSDTSGVVKLAVKIDEAYSFGLMYQCAKVVNRFLKLMTGTQKFKIAFLPVSIFNRDDMISKYKEALNFGIAKIPYLVSLGISQHDILNISYIENDVLNINTAFTPMKTASTQSSSDGSAGRPLMDDIDLTEDGASTRASDSNDNR